MDQENDQGNKDSSQEKHSDAIERLERELYRKENPSILRPKRHQLEDTSPANVGREWQEQEKKESKFKKVLSGGIVKKILIASIAFFVIALSVSLFFLFSGSNSVSPDNISITAKGLTSIEAGAELSLDVTVKNNNKVGLRDVSLTLEYPEGARNPENIQQPLLRQEESTDSLSAGADFSKNFKSVIYGESQSVKNIKMIVEYKTENSNTVFKKEEVYEIGIRSSPVSVVISAPKEAISGQEVSFQISISSNSTSPIKDLMLTVEYPFDFSFVEASPEPTFDNRIWFIGDLEPREKKEFTLKGKISGQEKDEKTFRFAVGIKSETSPRDIGVEFLSSLEPLVIKKPEVGLALSIEGTRVGDYITKLGNNLKAQIEWNNNFSTDLNDVTFTAKIDGRPLDKFSVASDRQGFYRSQDSTIVWSKDTGAGLSTVKSGQGGIFSFSFGTTKFSAQSASVLKNSEIDLEVTMTGTRIAESRPPEFVSFSATRKVKVETDLSLSARAVHSVGPFQNTGSLPPQAEKPTTYTVFWSVSNTSNDVENTVVNTTLPVYVEWLGNVSPKNIGEVTFNPASRTVSWNAGRVLAGTGYLNSPLEIAFQVVLTPSVSQVGSVPTLIEDSSIVATDSFTKTDVSRSAAHVDTKISTDPLFTFGIDRVVP